MIPCITRVITEHFRARLSLSAIQIYDYFTLVSEVIFTLLDRTQWHIRSQNNVTLSYLALLLLLDSMFTVQAVRLPVLV